MSSQGLSVPCDLMICRRAILPLLVAIAVGPASSARAGEVPAAEAKPESAADKKTETSKEKEAEDSGKVRKATLADKIAPVSGNLFTKARRFEISPTVGVSLDDAFFQKYEFGLKLTYHIVESFSIGLHGSYSLATPGGAVDVCKSDGCSSPGMSDLKNLPGRIFLLTGFDLAWSPFYGKVNVLAEKVLHFDTSIFVGADAVQYQAPGETKKVTVGGHAGIGERFFITPSTTLRLELRDYVYSAEVHLGDANSKIENQLLLELGLSFFVGGGS